MNQIHIQMFHVLFKPEIGVLIILSKTNATVARPVVLYEDSGSVLEQLLQAALGTVLMQVLVDIVDVLNRGGELCPLQLVPG